MTAITQSPILPPEIILLIAGHLGDDVQSISNLYRTSTTMRRTLCFHLYQSVYLESDTCVTSLCQSSTSFRHIELGHIRSLQIGLTWSTYSVPYKLQSDPVPPLCSALQNMPRLSVLSLSITPGALDDLLENLDPPFQLTEFIHSGNLSPILVKFLEKQPSITKLGWYSLFHEEQPGCLSSLLEDNSIFLPALGELAGPIRLLSILVPRRSITKMRVMYHTLPFLRRENSATAFSHPMGRLSSICIVEYRLTWQNWAMLVSKLETTCMRYTIKEMHIVEAFTGPSPLSQRDVFRAHISRLAHFDSLEHVEISRALGTKVLPQVVYERLRSSGMDRISGWKTVVPSLKSATVYDYQLS